MGDTDGWIKLYRQALESSSSFRKLSISHRGVFVSYLLIARYRRPYVGCLCDNNGKPWGLRKRAASVGCSIGTLQRAEVELSKQQMITRRESGIVHISQFGEYQGVPETEHPVPETGTPVYPKRVHYRTRNGYTNSHK